MEKFLLFLMQGIPESAGYIALSLALAGAPLRWKRIAAAAALFAIVLFWVRSLPMTFGMHSLVSILLLTFAIAKTTTIPVFRVSVSVFAGFMTIAFLEHIIFDVLVAIFGINLQSLVGNTLLFKLLGLPQAALLIVIALLVPRHIKPQPKVWKI